MYGGTGAALGIMLMIGIILLAGESFLSYVVLGSYWAASRNSATRLEQASLTGAGCSARCTRP